jgi:hypothetical protein
MMELHDFVEPHRDWLSQRGHTIVQSGAAEVGGFQISLHSDYGPPDQDKGPENQDFALAWYDRDSQRFAVAVADGLTDSYRSEWAASLACWVAVRTLVERWSDLPPLDLAHAAFDAAGHAIGGTADAFAANPIASLPVDQFLSTWEFMLRKGKLLQTTLMLAWLDQHAFRVAALGDGGAVWRGVGKNLHSEASNQVLAHCDLDTNLVHPIGPATRCGHAFDCWIERAIDGPFLCAIYTDGLGRALGTTPLTLLEELGYRQELQSGNQAQHYVGQALRDRPHQFADNVTLAVIRSIFAPVTT